MVNEVAGIEEALMADPVVKGRVPALATRLRRMISPSSAAPTDITLLEAAEQLEAAEKLLRRWRKRDVRMGLPNEGHDPDPKLFSESGWFCSLIVDPEAK